MSAGWGQLVNVGPPISASALGRELDVFVGLLDELAQPKVGYLSVPHRVEQNVPGLEVVVDDGAGARGVGAV